MADNGDSGKFSGGIKFGYLSGGKKKKKFHGFDMTFSRAAFDEKSSSDGYYVDAYNVNYNYEIEALKMGKLRTVVYTGPGYYKHKDDSDSFGARVGLGLVLKPFILDNAFLRPFNSDHVYFDLSGNYHIIADDVDDFSEIRFGINATFK
ncbi:hypothetical protein ACFL2A_02070 [Thermodesulfobacteriota bacterium]